MLNKLRIPGKIDLKKLKFRLCEPAHILAHIFISIQGAKNAKAYLHNIVMTTSPFLIYNYQSINHLAYQVSE